MKLKKIASLMLAGVMAVSMLTACDTTSAGDDTVVPPAEDTTPAGYSATILNGTSSNTKSLMTSEDSAMLENAVKAAASSIVSMDDIHDMLHMSEYPGANNAVYYTRNTTTHKVMDGFKDNLAEDVIYDWNEMYNGFWGMPAKNSGVQRYVGLYVYNRALNDTQVNNDVAGIVNTIMSGEKDHVNATDIDYVLSVAKSDVGTEANGVVLVGVMIERSYTHAA